MSDVSEHDSDSDTEVERKKVRLNDEKKVEDEKLNSNANVAPTKAVTSAPEDIVKELKQQADSVASASTQGKEQSNWEQYMQQDNETGAYTYTDPNDGTVYEWDAEKRGWIPKIDEDFIAMYQANYGFTASGEHDPNVNVEPEKPAEQVKPKDKEEKTKEENSKKRKDPEWFTADQKTNNNIYISGLPVETTEEEFMELVSKFGIIMQDDQGRSDRDLGRKRKKSTSQDVDVKNQHESVDLAIELLDESDFNGSTINVEQAVFELKGEFDPKLKPKKKKKKKKKGGGQDKLLDWVDRPQKRSKFDRIVILKNMFNHKEFEKDPTLINDLKGDLRSECERFGEIKKVLVFDRNPEGVASILFHEPEMADECIAALNGRFYGGRTISAETYDGKTDYQVKETEEEEKRRLDEWEKFIAADDDENEDDNKEKKDS